MPPEFEIPDLDHATESGNPKLPEGTYDLVVEGMRLFKSTDPTLPPALMFGADFVVEKVIAQGPIRTPDPVKDKNPPPGPVQVDEIRSWTANTSQKKALFRIRELMQACLRFVPSSKEADTAIGPDGKPISWNGIMQEAVGEENPFGQNKVRIRCTITRIITQRGAGFAMYVPTFTLPDDITPRSTNKVESF